MIIDVPMDPNNEYTNNFTSWNKFPFNMWWNEFPFNIWWTSPKTLSHKHGESVCGDVTHCTNFTPRFVSIQDRHNIIIESLSILDSYFFKRCSSDVVSHEGLEFLSKVEPIKVRLTI